MSTEEIQVALTSSLKKGGPSLREKMFDLWLNRIHRVDNIESKKPAEIVVDSDEAIRAGMNVVLFDLKKLGKKLGGRKIEQRGSVIYIHPINKKPQAA